MRQVPTPEGEYPRVSQFQPEKPYHRIITPGYKPYQEACERARKMALSMMNEEKEKGTFDPVTFVTDVWQKSPAYQETEKLWRVYLGEIRERLQDDTIGMATIVRKDMRDLLKSVA